VIDLTKLTPEQRRHAESFAQDEVLGLIIQSLLSKYIHDWRTTLPEQAKEREYLHVKVQVVEALQAEFNTIANDRKVSAFNKKTRD
jgi:hypothetical protein